MKTIGFALCGSFCTLRTAVDSMRELRGRYSIVPIMSYNAYSLDTRFGQASDFVGEIEEICKRKVITSIQDAEPIGPKRLVELMLVAPCTGNTLAKLRAGITDTPVTMAVKSHMRNGGRTLIALSSNDALFTGAENLGAMAARRDTFFVPLVQDDCAEKPYSLVADYSRLSEAVEAALAGKQLRPAIF